MAFDLENSTVIEEPIQTKKFELGTSKKISDFDARSVLPKQDFSVFSDEGRKAIKAKGKIGWVEAVVNQSSGDLLPFSPTGAVRSVKLLNAVNRLKKNSYDDDEARIADKTLVTNFAEKSEEQSIRGYKWYSKAYLIGSQLPAFAIEFVATGGIASVGKKLATRGAIKAVGHGVRKGASKIATKTVALAAGAGLRSVAMPHRYVAKYGENQVNASLAVTDKGLKLLKDSKESPAISSMKAFGDTWIENFSEELGGALSVGVGKIGKAITMKSGLARRFVKAIDKLVPDKQFMTSMKKLGFNGALEEYGEERVGGALRAVTGVDDRDIGMFDKLTEAIFPKAEDAMIELGLFSVMGGSSFAYSAVKQRMIDKGKTPEQVETVMNNTTETEKEEILSQEMESDPVFKKEIENQINTIKVERMQEATTPEKVAQEGKEATGEGVLIEEAKKYKSVEKFIGQVPFSHAKDSKSRGIIRKGLEGETTDKNINELIPNPKNQEIEQSTVKIYEGEISKGKKPFLVIDEKGNVIDGHHKLEAYNNLGITEVPVVTKQQLTDIWNKANKVDKVVEVKPVKIEPKEPAKKVSSQAKKTAKKNVKKIGKQAEEGLSKYTVGVNKEQLSEAKKYIKENPEEAKLVSQGLQNAPKGILNNAVYGLMRQKAENDMDIEEIYKYTTQNKRTEYTSQLGQEIQILSAFDSTSPVSTLQDVISSRKKNYNKKTKKETSSKTEVAIIKKKIKKADMAIEDMWNDFLTEIEC